MIYQNSLELIGNTPMVKINKLNKTSNTIYAKIEAFNPMSSVKDRIANAIVERAEKEGKLKPGGTIIEATSGNTGIGLALVSAVKGYKLYLVMPETMSVERRKIVSILGAELVLTPGAKGMKGAIEKAEEMHKEIDNSILASQFKNPANPDIHKKTTAQEIVNDLGDNVDIFVAGIGTGGTITGVGETLKKQNSNTKIVGVEPKSSNVLSGGTPGPHKIQGIGAGFAPDVLNVDILDEVVEVTNEEAFESAKLLAKEEGLFVGISSGAAFSAALKVAKKYENKNIVVIFPDTGERYLTLDFWDK